MKKIKETVKISFDRYEEMREKMISLEKDLSFYKKQSFALYELFGEKLKYKISPEQTITAFLEEDKNADKLKSAK